MLGNSSRTSSTTIALGPSVVTGISPVVSSQRPSVPAAVPHRLSKRWVHTLIVVTACVCLLGVAAAVFFVLQGRHSRADQRAHLRCSCPPGNVCLADGACVQCSENDDCAAGNVCMDNRCRLPCISAAQCPADAAKCFNGACIACVQNTDCVTSGSGKVCVNGSCVQCISEVQCGAGERCASGSCAPACGATDDSGTACGATQVCDFQRNVCVECVPGSAAVQCLGAKPYCSKATYTCVQCLQDSDCPSQQAENCPSDGSFCPDRQLCSSTGACVLPVLSTLQADTERVFLVQNPVAQLCLTVAADGSTPEWQPCVADDSAQWWMYQPAANITWFGKGTSVEAPARLVHVLSTQNTEEVQGVLGSAVQLGDAAQLVTWATGNVARMKVGVEDMGSTGFAITCTALDGQQLYLTTPSTAGAGSSWGQEKPGAALQAELLRA